MISDIEVVVLGLITEGLQYGYEIEKEIKSRNIRLWTEIAFSSIYYVLNRLEKKGYITSSLQQVEGKPSRRVYAPTTEGWAVLKERLVQTLSTTQKVVQPFNLGIGFMSHLKPGVVVECLGKYLESIDMNIEYAKEGLARVERDRRPYFIKALYSRPLATLVAERAWVESFIVEIKSQEKAKEAHHLV